MPVRPAGLADDGRCGADDAPGGVLRTESDNALAVGAMNKLLSSAQPLAHFVLTSLFGRNPEVVLPRRLARAVTRQLA